MKSIGLVFGRALVVAGLLISAGSALAGKSDDGFAAFWTQFSAAVGRSDRSTVSQMVRYPIYHGGQRQVADFPAIWEQSFGLVQRKCLAKVKPVMDTHEGKVSYAAGCGELIFVFSKDDAGWKLTDFSVND